MWRPFLLAVFSLLAAFPALSADRVISQTVDTSTARVQPAAIGFFRGESVAYTVTPRLGSAAITVSTNATATWTVCPQTSTTTAVLEVSGAVATNGVCVFASPIASNTMAAGAYDSFVRIQDGATLVTASRSTLYVYKSPYPDSPSVVPYSFAEPLWMSASNRVVYSNQMGSGATWTGTNWTFASSGTSENFATNAAFLSVSNAAINAYPSSNPSNYVTATITNGLGGTFNHAALTNLQGDVDYQHVSTTRVALIDSALQAELDPGWTAASGSVAYAADLATYPALTDTVARAGSAWQNPVDATNWTWTSDGSHITLTGYTGPADVVVPDMLDGLPVTGFGTIFANLGVTNISGGVNITTISDTAFYGGNLLISISLPNVTTIGNEAFKTCDALTSVGLPNATTIGNEAFYNCNALTSVSLPNATTIGNEAFYNCNALTSVSLPNATTIGEGAFYVCPALTSVSLPSATTIGNYAFDDCPVLTSVRFGQNAPAEAADVYLDTPNVTNYVTDPTATGWGATWNGRPVVRLPLYGNGSALTGITAGQVNAVSNTAAGIAAAGGVTNKSTATAMAIDCSPTTTITRAMIEAAPLGEMSLALTQGCYLTLDATVTNTADVIMFGLYISNTNPITWNTNQLTGTAWTNATATGSDRLFRKAARAGTVAIW